VIWVGWRQQRTEAFVAAGILALLAALLVPTGLHMHSAYDDAGLSACLGANASDACRQTTGSFVARFRQIASLISWFTLVPGLIGVLLAAPIVLQFEQRTNRLDWTQSITRGRWIGAKLAVAVAAALAAAGLLTLLVTWWRSPLVQIEGRMDNSVFDAVGIAALGYTLFALGLAVALGVVWRRGVPTLVVAFIGYFAARLFVDASLRQHLLAPHSLTWSPVSGEPAQLARSWILREFPSDRHGHAVSLPCAGVHGPDPKAAISRCLEHAPPYLHAIYEPASSFWALQIRETVLFAGVAALLIAFAAWWATHRAT